MKHKELKPCPFCGGSAEIYETLTYRGSAQYTPRCKHRSCCGRLSKKWKDRETAVITWNRRGGRWNLTENR